ncbi:MAG: hypothetical protein VKN33_05880 [Candidatus Sericytochromatia bacterium]|nr:hypothetical protein [Candidatus Sericytochromatia bacterium]
MVNPTNNTQLGLNSLPPLPTGTPPIDVPHAPPVSTAQANNTDQVGLKPQGPATAITLEANRPAPDTGKTWGGPDSKVELNFGHKPDAQGRLYKLDPSGVPVWASNGRAITPDQMANMPAFQKEAIAALVPEAQRNTFTTMMSQGVAERAWRPKPEPGQTYNPNIPLGDSQEAQMASLAQLAVQRSQGKGPDGMCYKHVADWLEYSGVRYGNFPDARLSGMEARNFSELVNPDPGKYGLKRLDIDNPYDAPPGAIVVVRAGTPGTAHPTAGDIAVATGKGWFANGGEMGYGGAGNFPPGNNYVLGVYVPA